MKKLFIRLSVVTLAVIMSLGVLTVRAETGVDDGDIDIRDLVRLKKYTAGIEGTKILKSAADLNGDGNYDAVDLSELRIMLLNI